MNVSDSDDSDSEKQKKKKAPVKKDKNENKKIELPQEPVTVTTDVQDEDVSSVNTIDFIRPLSISNELEEEALSDIEEEE